MEQASDDASTVTLDSSPRPDALSETVDASIETATDTSTDAGAEAEDADACLDDAPPYCETGVLGWFCCGACVDIERDRNNCGACGVKCCAGSECVAGACAVECPAGETACPDPTTGCGSCVDLFTDSKNCGACGNVCLSEFHCGAGRCVG